VMSRNIVSPLRRVSHRSCNADQPAMLLSVPAGNNLWEHRTAATTGHKRFVHTAAIRPCDPLATSAALSRELVFSRRKARWFWKTGHGLAIHVAVKSPMVHCARGLKANPPQVRVGRSTSTCRPGEPRSIAKAALGLFLNLFKIARRL
jgi:hypothetical protein